MTPAIIAALLPSAVTIVAVLCASRCWHRGETEMVVWYAMVALSGVGAAASIAIVGAPA